MYLISESSTPFIQALRVAFGFVQCLRTLLLRAAAARFTMFSYAHSRNVSTPSAVCTEERRIRATLTPKSVDCGD